MFESGSTKFLLEKQVSEAFKALGQRLPGAMVRKALYPVTEMFQGYLRQVAPRLSNKLVDNLSIKVEKRDFNDTNVVIGVQGLYYARFVEFGHANIKHKRKTRGGEKEREFYFRKSHISKHGSWFRKSGKRMGESYTRIAVRNLNTRTPKHPFVAPMFEQHLAKAQEMALEALSAAVIEEFNRRK